MNATHALAYCTVLSRYQKAFDRKPSRRGDLTVQSTTKQPAKPPTYLAGLRYKVPEFWWRPRPDVKTFRAFVSEVLDDERHRVLSDVCVLYRLRTTQTSRP